MKRKLAAGVLSAALLVGGATAAFGATDSAKLDEIKSLTQQMFGIHKQIVVKEVEAGLLTQQQADAMNKSIDQRQQSSEQALANGQVFGPGMGRGIMGKGMRKGDGTMINNGQPMTAEQIKVWSDAAQARLTAQVEAMKSDGKLTAEQIETWSNAAKAQLQVQAEALKNGTFVPGGVGMGVRGGRGGCAWGGTKAPTTSTTPTASATNTQ